MTPVLTFLKYFPVLNGMAKDEKDYAVLKILQLYRLALFILSKATVLKNASK